MNRPLVLSGRYELGKLIGRGGMADVFEGRDLRLDRTVAVKMLRPDMARDSQFRARFEREARAVAALNHASIVGVYDTGEQEADPHTPHSVALPYIVMEYVGGRTLREIVREGQLGIAEAVEYMLGVLAALEYSHRHGIVHRDIKPANVMVCGDTGAVKVMDFGIARAMADSAATMTQTQAVVGTAQYLSPEQARGEVVDTRSDLYSAGCLLYELLAGRPPFIGESPVSIAYQHVQSQAAPASDFNPDVTPALQSVIEKAMEKDPDHRFQDAGAFRRALRQAKAGIPVAAAGPTKPGSGPGAAAGVGAPSGSDDGGVPTQAVPVASVESTGRHAALVHLGDTGQIPAVPPREDLIGFTDHGEDDREERARRRRRTWVAVVLTLALLALGAGGIWLYTSMNRPAPVAMATVPSVETMRETEAALQLQAAGFAPKFERPKSATVPKGIAIGTVPAAGSQLEKGGSVILQISDGPEDATIPETIIGATESGARATLQALGLTVKPRSVLANHATAPFGTVIGVTPGPGKTVGIGSEVELTVSTGRVAVPEVRGLTLEAATKALADLGLKADVREAENSVVAPGTVTDQSPAKDGTVDQGGTVVITVAKAPPAPSPSPSPTPSPSATRKGGDGNGNPGN